MNHAITCSFVPTSGAITSVCGPTKGIISCVYRRDSASSSRRDSDDGSTVTPSLAPPYGRPDRAHFQLIHTAKAATSPMSTCGAKRVPPLVGPMDRRCWTRKPWNTAVVPSSRWIGQDTVIARFG